MDWCSSSNLSVDHLIWTADSLEKTLMLGKIEGRRRRGQQRIRWLDNITDALDTNLGKLLEMVRDRDAWCAAVHGVTKSQTRLGDGHTNSGKLDHCNLDLVFQLNTCFTLYFLKVHLLKVWLWQTNRHRPIIIRNSKCWGGPVVTNFTEELKENSSFRLLNS